MDKINAFAKRHNLLVIEDNAEAFGGAYKGKKTGTLSEMAGWSFCQNKTFTTGGEGGINGHINSLGHEPHNYCVIYVQVDDLAASIKKAEGLGGKKIVPPMEVPGMGHFAWISDPEGTMVGLWKPVKK